MSGSGSASGGGGGGGARDGCSGGGGAATLLRGVESSPPNDAGPMPPLYCRYSSSLRTAEVRGVLSAELGVTAEYDDGGGSTLHVFTFGGSGGGAVALPPSPSPKEAQPCCAEAASLLPHRTGGFGGGAAAEAGGEFHAESMSSLRHWARPSDALRRGVPCSDDDDMRDGGSAPASRNGRVARHSL